MDPDTVATGKNEGVDSVEAEEVKSSPKGPQTNPFWEMFGGSEPAPQADIEIFVNEKHLGRLRKYEEVGLRGDLPVCEVVRFRYATGRHIEGMSKDMQDEYEYWYFQKPNRAKDGDKYDKHVRAWKRREKWLQTPGSSPNPAITNLSEARQARRRGARN